MTAFPQGLVMVSIMDEIMFKVAEISPRVNLKVELANRHPYKHVYRSLEGHYICRGKVIIFNTAQGIRTKEDPVRCMCHNSKDSIRCLKYHNFPTKRNVIFDKKY